MIVNNSKILAKFNPKLTKNNSIVFETEGEIKDFLNELTLELENATPIKVYCTDGIYHGTAWTTGLTSLVFDVSVSGGCIKSITGHIDGLGIPYSWSQGESNLGCSSGSVCGSLNVNIFLNGIGTVYSINQCFKISISC